MPPIDVPSRADLRVEPRLAMPKIDALRAERPRVEPTMKGARPKRPAPDLRATEASDTGERREPFFGKPRTASAGPTKPAAPAHDVPRIKIARRDQPGLPWMMTRLEPAERATAPASAARPVRAARARGRGAWAIGLGAVLLIAGVTSPAAIWQHLRTTMPARLDQALLDAAPAPTAPGRDTSVPDVNSPDANSEATAVAPPPASIMQAEKSPTPAPAPQPPQTQSQPQTQPEAQKQPQAQADASAAKQPAPTPPKTASTQPATKPPATELAEVQDGGELEDAPIVAPPAPSEVTATASAVPQQPKPLQPEAPKRFRTAPRVFQPDQNAPTPFQPSTGAAPLQGATAEIQPSTAGATPLQGASAQIPPSAAESVSLQGASAQVSLTPSLPPVLKPDPDASSTAVVVPEVASNAPQTSTTRKPVDWGSNPPQSLDQMFNLLIDTLASGRPAGPIRDPGEPNRR